MLWKMIILGHYELSFLKGCPLLRGSFIRGSTAVSSTHDITYSLVGLLHVEVLLADFYTCIHRASAHAIYMSFHLHSLKHLFLSLEEEFK